MGEVRVPATRSGGRRRSGPRTLPDLGRAEPREVTSRSALIKAVAAEVNGELGVLEADMAEVIVRPAPRESVGESGDVGRRDFPIDVFQTGSGTSSNMNANEVIATLADPQRLGRPVHPNDHVNASQSSNDVFPSAIHMAALVDALRADPALDHLAVALGQVRRVRRGGQDRPHPPDGCHAGDARPGVRRLRGTRWGTASRGCAAVLPGLRAAPRRHGGRHGLNTPPGFADRVIAGWRATELPFTEAGNHFEAPGGRDALVAAAASSARSPSA